MLKIGICLGDDIGLEVVHEAVKVMKAAAAKTGLAVVWQELPVGVAGHKLHGHTMGEWAGHPDMLDVDGKPLDLVVECRRCGMLVAIDAGLREVNGFAWRAFCGSNNLWRGAR